jgi:hypothetical protein
VYSVSEKHEAGQAVLLQSIGDAYTYMVSSTLNDVVMSDLQPPLATFPALANASHLLHMRNTASVWRV